MKYGVIQRNGVASSAHATMTEHFIRHGDYLTLVTIVDDPVYLEEPFIRTSQWVRTSNVTLDQRFIFEVVDEVAGHPQGYVPHYPLGTRQDGYAKNHGLPFEATQGGKETIYPEYELKLRQMLADMAAAGPNDAGAEMRSRRLAIAAGLALAAAGAASRCAAADPGRSPNRGLKSSRSTGSKSCTSSGASTCSWAAGTNVTAQVGEEGVTLVDAGGPGQGEKIVAAVRRLTKKPLRYLVNTSADAEQHRRQ